MWDAKFFREKAGHCRELAQLATNPRVKEQLLKFADEFEEDAAASEAAQRPSTTAYLH
jgi:hypothetical protein